MNAVAQSCDNVFTSYIITSQRARHSKQYAHTHTHYISFNIILYICYRKFSPHSWWARLLNPDIYIGSNLSPKYNNCDLTIFPVRLVLRSSTDIILYIYICIQIPRSKSPAYTDAAAVKWINDASRYVYTYYYY